MTEPQQTERILKSIDTSTPKVRGRRVTYAVIALALSSCLGLVAAEGILRFLLFSDSSLAREYGTRLRRPNLYAGSQTDSDYHKLRYGWKDADAAFNEDRLHPELGWLSRLIVPADLQHTDRSKLKGRRPFLMYGDSFTACMGPSADCWQGLIRRSPLKDQLSVVNYGVRGHGLGQIYLTLKGSVGLWLDRDPVVAVGILLDDDLDRVVLDFREAPKPVFDIEGGALTVDYPGAVSIESWLAEHPVEIRSYLWAFLDRGGWLLPKSWTSRAAARVAALRDRKRAISRLLLIEIRDELEERGLDYFFIIFEGPRDRRTRTKKQKSWQALFLPRTLDQLGIPWVSAEKALREDRTTTGKRGNADYFIPDGRKGGRHYTAVGNQAAWGAILNGLDARFDGTVERPMRRVGYSVVEGAKVGRTAQEASLSVTDEEEGD